MPGRQPFEPHALALEVDPGPTRVPLHEAVVEAEGQPAQLVAPDELDVASFGQLAHDLRDWIITQDEPCQIGEVRPAHSGDRGRRCAGGLTPYRRLKAVEKPNGLA